MRCDFILTHENLDILGIEVLSLGYCNTIALKGITCAKKLTFMLNLGKLPTIRNNDIEHGSVLDSNIGNSSTSYFFCS